MTTLVLTLLRLGFLALLWVFVIALVLTVRKDVYGTQVRDRLSTNRQLKAKKKGKVAAGAPVSGTAGAPNLPAPPPRAPVLAVTAGPLTGTTIPLSQSPLVIGRSPDSALVLDDTYSSSRHARLFPSENQWWIEDLDSTNGTYVSGRRISTPTLLQPGTPIVIGKTTMELRP
ncbi:FHA domain-containing protein [Actinomycetaceae bacterium L2_0104]